ncbi:hypothetical protein MPDQ_007478 [Monascus purpureus]|uniref:Uncharacterized protein n=1 Tax=Monascus purpureus TaxID=5098 RepID=A0A507R539_MONPU|nr:hypothetical protein MPDQ_007478 [Monascus purpureus]BDD58832.1 hypothetical protein MAP00_004078 [Monascus purpureus]
MPRGIEYDEDISQSENPVLQENSKVHGVNSANLEMSRVYRTAELPEAALQPPGFHSGMGSRGFKNTGSGKGGRNPRTMGEKKGMMAHKMDGTDPWKRQEWSM